MILLHDGKFYLARISSNVSNFSMLLPIGLNLVFAKFIDLNFQIAVVLLYRSGL